MDSTKTEQTIRKLFRFGVFMKGVDSVFEIVGGLLLLLVPLDFITKFTVFITQEELVSDPNDFIANYILHLGSGLSLSATVFGGIYLMSHGVIKIGLVISLLKNKLWAYPLSLAVLGLFVIYQMFRYFNTHAIGLIFLTIFDLVVIWLIAREYQIVKKHLVIKGN
jgi:uncharacterized membrane protein